MNRLFGAKSTAPKPTLNDSISEVDSQIESIDVKISKLTAEATVYQQKMAKMRDGPGKSAVKQKIFKILEQRKKQQKMIEKLEGMSLSMGDVNMMLGSAKNQLTTADALQTSSKVLKKQYRKIDIDKIERLQDEMEDLMDMGNDIQESLSRSYGVPEDIDEEELEAELEALGEDVELNGVGESESMPGFMMDETNNIPEFIDAPPEQSKVKEAAG
ncbi:MAG: hypothetical protein M1820_000217 [Bogoriella megaspora]|nr:MAG: hypothetical protein M1820_000217 [Bogoriella megaspora]